MMEVIDMSKLIFKEIEKKDEKQLRNLIKTVLEGLENPQFFIPYADWELEELYDKTYAPLHGAYDGEKLVGMAQLYIREDFLKEYIDILGLNGYKVCELGGNLVLPEYRGQGIMYELINLQSKLAKNMGFDYIISMAHPDNIGSKKALMKLGLQYVKTTMVNETFLRDIFMMKL